MREVARGIVLDVTIKFTTRISLSGRSLRVELKFLEETRASQEGEEEESAHLQNLFIPHRSTSVTLGVCVIVLRLVINEALCFRGLLVFLAVPPSLILPVHPVGRLVNK